MSKPEAYALTGQTTGRPTDYRPEYCEQVVAWGKEGKSRTWMAAKIGVQRQRLYIWEEAHPEFKDALARAKDLEQLWWEDAGQEALGKREFQSSVWSRSMAARFPDDWREKSDVNMGGTLQVTGIKRLIVDPRDSDA